MAAPLFEQDEIEKIISCEKYLSSEALRMRARQRNGVLVRRMVLQVAEEKIPWPLELFMEEQVNGVRSEITLGLLADLEKRGRELVCHYDIQAGGHGNPDWSDGKVFKPYEPHKHIYCPENIKHGDLTGLRAALGIKIRGVDFAKRSEALFRIFCGDMHIVLERGHQLLLFE